MKALNVAMAMTLAVVFAVAGYGEQRVVKKNRLVLRGYLYYEITSEEPFTGIAVSYWPNGQKKTEYEYRDGKNHGKDIAWYENGQKMWEKEYCVGHLVSRKRWDEYGNPVGRYGNLIK